MSDNQPRVEFEFFLYFGFLGPAIGSIIAAILVVLLAPECIQPCASQYYDKYTFALIVLIVGPVLGIFPSTLGVMIARAFVDFFGSLSDRKSIVAGFLGSFLASPFLYWLALDLIHAMTRGFGELVVALFVPVLGLVTWMLLWVCRPRQWLGPLTEAELMRR